MLPNPIPGIVTLNSTLQIISMKKTILGVLALLALIGAIYALYPTAQPAAYEFLDQSHWLFEEDRWFERNDNSGKPMSPISWYVHDGDTHVLHHSWKRSDVGTLRQLVDRSRKDRWVYYLADFKIADAPKLLSAKVVLTGKSSWDGSEVKSFGGGPIIRGQFTYFHVEKGISGPYDIASLLTNGLHEPDPQIGTGVQLSENSQGHHLLDASFRKALASAK